MLADVGFNGIVVQRYLFAGSSGGSRYCDIGTPIDRVHLANLLRHVITIVLDNAHGIDPEISQADAMCSHHSVIDGPRKKLEGNILLIFRNS